MARGRGITVALLVLISVASLSGAIAVHRGAGSDARLRAGQIKCAGVPAERGMPAVTLRRLSLRGGGPHFTGGEEEGDEQQLQVRPSDSWHSPSSDDAAPHDTAHS